MLNNFLIPELKAVISLTIPQWSCLRIVTELLNRSGTMKALLVMYHVYVIAKIGHISM